MVSIRRNDCELWVEDEGEGPVVLFATGLSGTASFWGPQMRDFLAAGYRVVRWDQRGTGRSTRWEGRYTIDLMAEDAIAVLDALDIDRCLLVGHSAGGASSSTTSPMSSAGTRRRLAMPSPPRTWSRTASSARWRTLISSNRARTCALVAAHPVQSLSFDRTAPWRPRPLPRCSRLDPADDATRHPI